MNYKDELQRSMNYEKRSMQKKYERSMKKDELQRSTKMN